MLSVSQSLWLSYHNSVLPTLIHDRKNEQGISHDRELRALSRKLLVPRSHVAHQRAFSRDLNVPEKVGQACDWVADPPTEEQNSTPILITLVRCLK